MVWSREMCLAPTPGCKGSEQIFYEIQVQDAHAYMYFTSSLLGDWFTSVNLKDTYFYIPKFPSHINGYLRFAFQGTCYKFRILLFGLSLSLRVLMRSTKAAITWPHYGVSASV